MVDGSTGLRTPCARPESKPGLPDPRAPWGHPGRAVVVRVRAAAALPNAGGDSICWGAVLRGCNSFKKENSKEKKSGFNPKREIEKGIEKTRKKANPLKAARRLGWWSRKEKEEPQRKEPQCTRSETNISKCQRAINVLHVQNQRSHEEKVDVAIAGLPVVVC